MKFCLREGDCVLGVSLWASSPVPLPLPMCACRTDCNPTHPPRPSAMIMRKEEAPLHPTPYTCFTFRLSASLPVASRRYRLRYWVLGCMDGVGGVENFTAINRLQVNERRTWPNVCLSSLRTSAKLIPGGRTQGRPVPLMPSGKRSWTRCQPHHQPCTAQEQLAAFFCTQCFPLYKFTFILEKEHKQTVKPDVQSCLFVSSSLLLAAFPCLQPRNRTAALLWLSLIYFLEAVSRRAGCTP